MAARAVTKIKTDWSKISSVAHPMEVSKLNKLKSQVDANATKLATLADSLPKIDWAYYKAHASNPKIVDEIEKKYSAIKLEAPKAPAARLNDLKVAKEQDLARFEKFQEICKDYIESAELVKTKFKNMIPVKDMTPEDWALTFPDWAPTIENPSIPPHWGRTPGLTREEAIAFEQPDPLPYATKTAWKDWEVRKQKFYS